MAWPNSRLLTFVSRSTPVITAAFLNSVQDWVNNLTNAVVSLKALVVDGTGGNTVVPVAGTVQVSRTVADANEPSGNAVAKGQLNQEAIPAANAQINGSLLNVEWGYGIYSVGRWPAGAANGDYEVVLQTVPSSNNAQHCVVQVTSNDDFSHDRIVISKSVDGSNREVLRVLFKNAATDFHFDLTAFVM